MPQRLRNDLIKGILHVANDALCGNKFSNKEINFLIRKVHRLLETVTTLNDIMLRLLAAA